MVVEENAVMLRSKSHVVLVPLLSKGNPQAYFVGVLTDDHTSMWHCLWLCLCARDRANLGRCLRPGEKAYIVGFWHPWQKITTLSSRLSNTSFPSVVSHGTVEQDEGLFYCFCQSQLPKSVTPMSLQNATDATTQAIGCLYQVPLVMVANWFQ